MNDHLVERRDFLKSSLAGASGISVLSASGMAHATEPERQPRLEFDADGRLARGGCAGCRRGIGWHHCGHSVRPGRRENSPRRVRQPTWRHDDDGRRFISGSVSCRTADR